VAPGQKLTVSEKKWTKMIILTDDGNINKENIGTYFL
jgi:hypothetical protein